MNVYIVGAVVFLNIVAQCSIQAAVDCYSCDVNNLGADSVHGKKDANCIPADFKAANITTVSCEHGCRTKSAKQPDTDLEFIRGCAKSEKDTAGCKDISVTISGVKKTQEECICMTAKCNGAPKNGVSLLISVVSVLGLVKALL